MRDSTTVDPPSGLPRRLGLGARSRSSSARRSARGFSARRPASPTRLPGPLPLFAVWIVGGVLALCGALTLAEVAGAFPQTGGIYVFIREGWGRLAGLSLRLGGAASSSAPPRSARSRPLRRVFPSRARLDPSAGAVRQLRALRRGGRDRGDGGVQHRRRASGARWCRTSRRSRSTSACCSSSSSRSRSACRARAAISRRPCRAGSFSIAPFGLALVSVLWAYDGWADLSFICGEVKDPRRNMPRALILGTIAIIAIYLLANVAYLAVMPVEEIRAVEARRGRRRATADRRAGVMFVAMHGDALDVRDAQRLDPDVAAHLLRDGRRRAVLPPSRRCIRSSRRRTSRSRSRRCSASASCCCATFEQLADTFVTAILPFLALAVAAIFVLRRRAGYDPLSRAGLSGRAVVLHRATITAPERDRRPRLEPDTDARCAPGSHSPRNSDLRVHHATHGFVGRVDSRRIRCRQFLTRQRRALAFFLAAHCSCRSSSTTRNPYSCR